MAASWKALESLASFLVSVFLVVKLTRSLRRCPLCLAGTQRKEYRRSHWWLTAKSSETAREAPVVLLIRAAAPGMQLFPGISALLR